MSKHRKNKLWATIIKFLFNSNSAIFCSWLQILVILIFLFDKIFKKKQQNSNEKSNIHKVIQSSEEIEKKNERKSNVICSVCDKLTHKQGQIDI